MVTLSNVAIDVPALLQDLHCPEVGGTAVFIGTVRNNSDGKNVSAIEYTAYVPMAEKLMNEIAAEMRARWTIHRLVMVHRIGLVGVGEAAVFVAVATAHRAEAFDAVRYGIDRIKAVLPIWKTELTDAD
jgi:molybdopterin synthase catalytic subunit